MRYCTAKMISTNYNYSLMLNYVEENQPEARKVILKTYRSVAVPDTTSIILRKLNYSPFGQVICLLGEDTKYSDHLEASQRTIQ